MNTSRDTIPGDPWAWLTQRFEEILVDDPDADLSEGLAYALSYIERVAGEDLLTDQEGVEPMAELLDRSKKYSAWMPDECHWRFVWESHTDWKGCTWNWQAYRLEPGKEKYSKEGPWPEIEVFERLVTYSHKLTEDDRDDLLFYLHLGGLEEFLANNKTDWREQSEEVNTDESGI